MSVTNVLLIIMFMLTVVGFGQISVAGTWIDDFSDRTLEDWGGSRGFKFQNDEFSAGVNSDRFNFRGKKDNANLSIKNWKVGNVNDFTLEMKFMIRHLPAVGPEGTEGYWKICYEAFNEETHEHEGVLEFEFRHALGEFEERDVTSFWIERGVPEEHPEIGRIWGGHVVASAHFVYEKEVWYTLKIVANGNRYTFWVGDFALDALDDSVPSGSIKFNFVGRCNIWLDDFTVTGTDVPDGGPGFPRAVLPTEKIALMWGNLKHGTD